MFNCAKKENGKWVVITPKGEFGEFDEVIKDNDEVITDEGPQREFIVKKEENFWILRFDILSGEKKAELGPYLEIK